MEKLHSIPRRRKLATHGSHENTRRKERSWSQRLRERSHKWDMVGDGWSFLLPYPPFIMFTIWVGYFEPLSHDLRSTAALENSNNFKWILAQAISLAPAKSRLRSFFFNSAPILFLLLVETNFPQNPLFFAT